MGKKKKKIKIKWYQYFSIGAYVAGWFARAVELQPGEQRPVITTEEQAELGAGVAQLIAEMIDEDIEL